MCSRSMRESSVWLHKRTMYLPRMDMWWYRGLSAWRWRNAVSVQWVLRNNKQGYTIYYCQENFTVVVPLFVVTMKAYLRLLLVTYLMILCLVYVFAPSWTALLYYACLPCWYFHGIELFKLSIMNSQFCTPCESNIKNWNKAKVILLQKSQNFLPTNRLN